MSLESSSTKADDAASAGCASQAPLSSEWLAAGILCAIWLPLAVFFATCWQPVWQDEGMYTDPAANAYLGHGFTSTAWYAQAKDRFWAGNTPLHSMLLAGWFEVVGFSRLAVQLFNCTIFLLAAMLLWLTARRSDLIRTPAAGLLFLAILLLASGLTYNWVSGRYDCVGILVVACIPASQVFAAGRPLARNLLLLAAGALVPWAGLQALTFVALFLGLVLLFTRGRYFPSMVAVGAGAVLGLALLYAVYQAQDVWQEFLASVRPHTTGKKLDRAAFSGFYNDSLWLLLAGVLALGVGCLARKGDPRLALFGIAAGLGIPIVVAWLGKFPGFYDWMAVIPLAAVLCALLDRPELQDHWSPRAAWICAVAVCLLGLPQELVKGFRQRDARDTTLVDDLVRRNVQPADRVYAEYEAFYAVKTAAQDVYFRHYRSVFTPAEKASLTVLVVDPRNWQAIQAEVGGNWHAVDRIGNDRADPTYLLTVYRRNGKP